MNATAPAIAADAPTDAPPLYSARRHPNAHNARIWLSPADQRRLTKVIDKVAAITGRSPSRSILLRAGISALTHAADMVTDDRKRSPDTRGRRELALLWWVSEAARLVGADDQ